MASQVVVARRAGHKPRRAPRVRAYTKAGSALLRLFDKAGLTVAEVERRCGFHKDTLTSAMGGHRTLTPRLMSVVVWAMGLSKEEADPIRLAAWIEAEERYEIQEIDDPA